jgi:hypothetical protein
MTVEFRVGDLVVTSGSPTQGEIQISEIVDINGSSGSVGQFLGKSASGLIWEALQAASTSVPGIVQLTDSTSSVSTTTALTANQGYNLQQQINALVASSNLLLAGTIDASMALIATVTTEGASAGFTIGSPLPVAASGNDNYFVIVTIPGTMTPPGGSAYSANQGDWFLSNGTGWEFLDVGFNASYATTVAPGIVRLATDLDVQTGTDALDAVTSAGLQSKVSDSTSTTSSTTIASSTAVKAAYDVAAQAQTDATAAASAASSAQADAIQALSDASAAQSDATQALSDSAAAQSDATQALSDASSAQSDASQALLDAAAAQADADQALLDAAAASAAAATAGTDVGDLSTLTTTDKSSAVAAINEVNSAVSAAQADASQALLDAGAAQADASQALLDASTAQLDASAAQADASQALLDAAAAQSDANQALLDAAAAQGSANSAQADATQALSDASTAQSTADAALPKAGGTMTGVVTFDATQTFPGTVGDLDFQAKGDLVAGYGANTFGIQSIGTDGQVLTADSACASGMKWAVSGGGGGSAATPTALGTLYGCSDASAPHNTALGNGALEYAFVGCCNTAIGACAQRTGDGCGDTSIGAYSLWCSLQGPNIAIGCGAGCDISSGCYNVVIGTNVQTSSPSSQCELAIGYTTGQLWLSGDCSKAIKPGAGVIDCAGSCGTAGQVLQSTGSNAIQWASPAPGYNGYQGYTATTSGTKFNVTGYLGELGINFIGQLNIFTTYESGYNIPGSNALIFINGYNGTGSSTVQAMNTSTGTFAVESVLYPAYTDITVTFTPSITASRMNFYIRFLDAIGNGAPYNGNFFTPFLTLF